MKKIISICLSISLLCGCGGMKGLQRQSTQNLHKTVNENGQLYYNSENGHNSDVKMYVIDQHRARITIPIIYNKKIENIEKINTIPSLQTDPLTMLRAIGICHNCTFDSNDNSSGEYEYISIQVIDNRGRDSSSTFSPSRIWITDPLNKSKFKDMGIINAYFKVTPQEMDIVCNNKSCAVVDKQGNYVNKITINKSVTVNQKRIDELVAEEKKAEAKRKAEEAKKKAEENRKWRQKQRLQKKECPGLYRTLYWAQQTGYIDPMVGLRTAQRFEELESSWRLQQQ